MQQARWKLEERIKDLETLNASLCEDLAKKQRILHAYVQNGAKTGGRRDMNREAHRTGPLRMVPSSGPISPEVVKKLEDVLEETLLENIQLRSDIEVLGNEVEDLRKQLGNGKK